MYFIDDVSVSEVVTHAVRDTVLCQNSGGSVTLHAGNDGTSYLWSTGDTTAQTTVHDTGTYWCRSISGCGPFTDTFHVHNGAAAALLSADTVALCPSASVTLQAGAGYSNYLWGTGATTQSITVQQPGSYTLTATGSCGPVADSLYVSARPTTAPPMANDTVICQDVLAPLLAVTGANIKWYLSATDSSGLATQPAIATQIPGMQHLYITQSTNGCESEKAVVDITIVARPLLPPTADTVFCNSFIGAIGIPANTAWQYRWTTSDTLATLIPGTPGQYRLTATNTCGSDTEVFTVQFSDCARCVYAPTAFTPNADGQNDVFRPRLLCPSYSYQLLIYNRWGQIVYQSTNAGQGWDGTDNGRAADVGTYFYTLRYCPAYNLQAITAQGDFILMR